MSPLSAWSKAILIAIAAALFFQGKVVYLTAYSLLALYFGLRYAVRHTIRHLRASRTGERLRLFPGEKAAVRLEIKSDSPFPLLWACVEDEVDPNLRAQEAGEYRFGISLAPGGQRIIEYTIEAKNRGVYKVGPMRLLTGDPLGFDDVQVHVAEEAEVLVYPRIYPLDALGLGGNALSGSVNHMRRRMEDPTRMVGIRDYAPGESIRHVHWKATAHTQTLKVKTFESTEYDDMTVVLDLVRDHYRSWNVAHMSELAIEVAASLLAEASRRRQAFGFCMLGRLGRQGREAFVESGMRKGDAHLGKCLEMLARAEPADEQRSLAEAIDRVATRARGRTTIVLITPLVDPAIRSALMRIKNRGHRALVIEVSDRPTDEPISPGVQHVRVGYRGEISRTLAGRRPIAAKSRESTA